MVHLWLSGPPRNHRNFSFSSPWDEKDIKGVPKILRQDLEYPLINEHNYGKSPFFMGKSTISMAIFNSYVKLPEGTWNVEQRRAGASQNLALERYQLSGPQLSPVIPIKMALALLHSYLPFEDRGIVMKKPWFTVRRSISLDNTFMN